MIKEADTNNSGAIDYREFLQVLLKDKKGLLKGQWGSFGVQMKQHDDSTEHGKKANFFEKQIANQSVTFAYFFFLFFENIFLFLIQLIGF